MNREMTANLCEATAQNYGVVLPEGVTDEAWDAVSSVLEAGWWSGALRRRELRTKVVDALHLVLKPYILPSAEANEKAKGA